MNFSIWTPYQAFYIHSMLFNCQSAIISIDKLHHAFEECNPVNSIHTLSAHEILNELQNIVLQGASLSRYFWPVRKGYSNRGEFLRKALNVNEKSPLKSRELRNAIEHFDERLDEYISTEITGIILPEFVGNRPQNDGIPGHFFRAYFLDYDVFKLLDTEYEMNSLVSEIIRLNEILTSLHNNGGVFKYST